MSAPADLLLVAPGNRALVAALDQASEHGSSTLRALERWQAILDEVAGNAEGRSQVESSRPGEFGARYVSVAWWSDHQGTRHVRVCGGDTSRDDWHPHYSRLDHDLRPPLWHVFMDRVYRVTRAGEEPRWLVSCACGETGDPGALAWMGVRCGPCHDRNEEGQPHEDDARPVLLTCRGACHALAFSPDSRSLAAASWGQALTLFDLATGSGEVLFDREGEEDDYLRPLAFSPDGRHLATGAYQEWHVFFFDLHDGAAVTESAIDYRGDQHLRDLAYSPDNRLFATCSDWRALDLSTADGGLVHTKGHLPDRCCLFAFSPDGGTLAVAEGVGLVFLHDTHTWGPPRSLLVNMDELDEFLFLQYMPDGRRLVLITGPREPQSSPPHRLRLWDLKRAREERSADIPLLTRVAALTPDGRYLAHVVHDEQHAPGEILFFDLLSWKEAGRLEWDPEDPINDLAFSPDGQMLATASHAGVIKLWPWRLLLEG